MQTLPQQGVAQNCRVSLVVAVACLPLSGNCVGECFKCVLVWHLAWHALKAKINHGIVIPVQVLPELSTTHEARRVSERN